MGAKGRVWLDRAIMLMAIAAGVTLVLLAPLPAAIKAAVLLAAAIIALLIAFRTIPAFDPKGRIQWRLPADCGRACAITFDDGPSADTRRVLDILDELGVKATFFVLVGNAHRHPDILRDVVSRGHTIAVHGTTHRKLHHATDEIIDAELSTAESELTRMGAPPARIYRTPHGLKNAAVFRVAKRRGYKLWAWSRGIWDTDRTTADVLIDRATRLAGPRMVLLLHDGRGDEPTPDISTMVGALPAIVRTLRAKGLSFVTLDTV